MGFIATRRTQTTTEIRRKKMTFRNIRGSPVAVLTLYRIDI